MTSRAVYVICKCNTYNPQKKGPKLPHNNKKMCKYACWYIYTLFYTLFSFRLQTVIKRMFYALICLRAAAARQMCAVRREAGVSEESHENNLEHTTASDVMKKS